MVMYYTVYGGLTVRLPSGKVVTFSGGMAEVDPETAGELEATSLYSDGVIQKTEEVAPKKKVKVKKGALTSEDIP